jgi:hypothetical protein
VQAGRTVAARAVEIEDDVPPLFESDDVSVIRVGSITRNAVRPTRTLSPVPCPPVQFIVALAGATLVLPAMHFDPHPSHTRTVRHHNAWLISDRSLRAR